MSGEFNETGIVTFTAGEAIEVNRRVYLSAARTVSKAGVANRAIGITRHAVASGAKVAVKLFSCPGTLPMVAASSASVNALAYPAASGKVDDVGGSPIGYFLEAPSGDGSIVEVLHFGVAGEFTGAVQLTDPGAGGAIPVAWGGAKRAWVELVTAAAEARSVADPAEAGLDLLICLKTDGGDATVTFASDISQTAGENVATFNDAGDHINVRSIAVGGAYKWRLVGSTATQQGVALT